MFSKEEGIRRYLDEFIYRGFIEDDFIPGFFPGCRQGTIPGMFGAKEVIVGQDYSCERIVKSVEEIDSLPAPSIREGTPAWEWLEMQQYYLEECEGRIPVHVCDMQGPMDVCGQLWGYENLMLSVYEDTEAYHKIMKAAMQAYIMLWEAQEKLLGDHFIGTHLYGWDWVPDKNGATLSADSMVMVSPQFFEDYYVKYLKEIAQKFGRLSIHSCGNFKQIVPVLAKMEEIGAINASQMGVKELLEAGRDPQKVIITIEEIHHAEELFTLEKEKNLQLNLCFDGLWPCDKNGNTIPPADWNEKMKREITKKEEGVLESSKK